MTNATTKEQVFTFLSKLKSETGYVEIKFDFTESEFKELSEQKENEEKEQITSHAFMLAITHQIKKQVEELTKKPTYISEFSIYEEPPRE